MQTVNVTDIKVIEGVTKEGAKAGQKWKLIILIGDDGSEYTTFDTKAQEVGIGGVIELEPVVKGGKVNFTKFTIKKKGTPFSPTVGGASTSTNGDSPEKRKSIEDQTRAERITELWIAGKILDDDSLVKKLRTWLEKLGSPVAQPKQAEKPEPAESSSTEEETAFQLVNRAMKGGWKMEEIKTKLGIQKPEDIIDVFEAARALEL